MENESEIKDIYDKVINSEDSIEGKEKKYFFSSQICQKIIKFIN